MSLGRRIASMRGFRTMTQEQLGGLIGVSKPTVSNWENDRRTPDADNQGTTGQHYDRPHAEQLAAAVADAYRARPYDDGWDV